MLAVVLALMVGVESSVWAKDVEDSCSYDDLSLQLYKHNRSVGTAATLYASWSCEDNEPRSLEVSDSSANVFSAMTCLALSGLCWADTVAGNIRQYTTVRFKLGNNGNYRVKVVNEGNGLYVGSRRLTGVALVDDMLSLSYSGGDALPAGDELGTYRVCSSSTQCSTDGHTALSCTNSVASSSCRIPVSEASTVLIGVKVAPSYQSSMVGYLRGKVTPSVLAPVSPADLSCEPGDGRLACSWRASSGATSYVLTASPGNVSITSGVTTVDVSGLTNGVTYTVSVVARNVGGDSAASTVTASPAGSPTVTLEVLGGTRALRVSWTSVANGSAVNSTAVASVPALSGLTSCSMSPCELTDVEPGSYTVTVSLTNGVGTSVGAASVAVSGSQVVPWPPTGVTVAGDSAGTVRLSWTPGVAPNSAAVTSHNYGCADRSGSTSTASTVLVSGLTVSSVECRVQAVNSVGLSDWATVEAVVPLVPAAPDAPAVAGTTATAANVQWGAVADAQSYRVELDSGSGFGATVVTSALSHVYGSLVEGRTYGVRVAAVGTYGVGPWSPVVRYRHEVGSVVVARLGGVVAVRDLHSEGDVAIATSWVVRPERALDSRAAVWSGCGGVTELTPYDYDEGSHTYRGLHLMYRSDGCAEGVVGIVEHPVLGGVTLAAATVEELELEEWQAWLGDLRRDEYRVLESSGAESENVVQGEWDLLAERQWPGASRYGEGWLDTHVISGPVQQVQELDEEVNDQLATFASDLGFSMAIVVLAGLAMLIVKLKQWDVSLGQSSIVVLFLAYGAYTREYITETPLILLMTVMVIIAVRWLSQRIPV